MGTTEAGLDGQDVSLVLATPSGDIEFNDAGTGPAVLVVHGSPGGLDQSLLMGRFLRSAGFRTISVSRPGYLRTPLGAEVRSLAGQADLLAALLDRLHLGPVGVLGWSGAGPSIYALAARHPHHVAALVPVSAMSRSEEWNLLLRDRLIAGTRTGRWLLDRGVKIFPRQFIAASLDAAGTLPNGEAGRRASAIMATPEQRDFMLDLADTVDYGPGRAHGLANDRELFKHLDDLPLAQIPAPTLVIHGDLDRDVPYGDAEFAVASIPGARLHTVPGGTHMALFADTGAAAAQEYVLRFLAATIPA